MGYGIGKTVGNASSGKEGEGKRGRRGRLKQAGRQVGDGISFVSVEAKGVRDDAIPVSQSLPSERRGVVGTGRSQVEKNSQISVPLP